MLGYAGTSPLPKRQRRGRLTQPTNIWLVVRDWRAGGYPDEILDKVFYKNAERWLAECGVCARRWRDSFDPERNAQTIDYCPPQYVRQLWKRP